MEEPVISLHNAGFVKPYPTDCQVLSVSSLPLLWHQAMLSTASLYWHSHHDAATAAAATTGWSPSHISQARQRCYTE